MTDYERGYEQGKAYAAKKMHPEMRKMWEDYFDKCFKEYDKHLRPWVGLTDAEIKRIGKLDWDDNYVGLWYDFAKAIEDKLRERNT
jgi:hypothetical protein